jgi:hypothetical protein
MKQFILTTSIIALILILFNAIPAYSQNNNTAITPTPTVTPVQTDNEQIAALKAQIEIMREYHERILDTVYWSLGALGGVIFIVLGLGFYNNKRNVDELKQDIKFSLHKELLAEINVSATEEIKKITTRELKNIAEMQKNFQKIKYDSLKRDVEDWKTRGVYPNVLSTSLDLIEIAISMDNEYKILECLEYIKQGVKLGIVGEDGYKGTYLQLLETLDSIPDKFAVEVESIRNIIKTKRSE